MNLNLFKPLKDLSVQIHVDNKIYPIPPIQILGSIDELLRMIDWLGSEAARDREKTDKLIHSEKALNKRPPIRDQWDMRIGSRTLSYVNHLYLLNGILKRAFKNTEKILSDNKLDKHIDKKEVESRLKEISDIFEPIETFRHKVAAHTSFSFPKGDDGLLQVNSLLNLTPRPGSEILGGQSFVGGYNNSIPLVTLTTYESDIESYFGKWVELYEKILLPLQKKFNRITRGHIYIN